MAPEPPTPPSTNWIIFWWAYKSWRSWEWPMYVVMVPLVLAPIVGAVGWIRSKILAR